MSIQFRCSGCDQPIEVDDEHAGKMAACPYCHRVVAVPQTSTFEGGPIMPARPAGSPEGETPTLPTPPTPEWQAEVDLRARAARRLGNYAWICLGITIALLAAAAFIVGSLMFSKLGPGQITPESLHEVQTQVEQELAKRSDFIALSFAFEVLSVVALALSVASVVRSPQRNARGIAALIVSALFVLCICGGSLFNPLGRS
jgi:DNA-directed RNA polymerase subunit RPC12/RpoP